MATLDDDKKHQLIWSIICQCALKHLGNFQATLP